jgi:hypothetical protein
MALYSSQGAYGNLSDFQTLVPAWENYVNLKYLNDPTWPFNISVESYDVLTDFDIVNRTMTTRYKINLYVYIYICMYICICIYI